MTGLTENAIRVLEARYLRRDARGNIVETPEQMFRRVASAVAQAETRYGGPQAAAEWERRFFEVLSSLTFLPNSPTLMNAGTPLGQLSACFVLPVEDSIAGIFETLKLAALIQQSGGGTGFSFSRLRPEGDYVASTGGRASGPVSFMKIFDAVTEHIKQGGKRRGANMGVLRIDHPDIEKFIDSKRDGQSLRNFNISVGATDAFMRAVAAGESIELINPRNGERMGVRSADALFARIADAAWATGDPGMLFLDTINRANPTPELGQIEATNPCGEVPLLPYEACNLGSINLARFVRESPTTSPASSYADGPHAGTASAPAPSGSPPSPASAWEDRIDWPGLGEVAALAMRFLDDVIDVSRRPAPQIDAMVLGNRKVGLGVMGFAAMLLRLGIPYSSQTACDVAERVMGFLSERAWETSAELAEERGVFPNWSRSIFARRGRRVRNATCTSVAPTGTIGIIAGTSSGIEPLFALAYRRTGVLGGQTLVELNPFFERAMEELGDAGRRAIRWALQHGTLDGCPDIPPAVRELFRTALEIPPEHHLRIQAAFQRHCDNAVSKTINMPHDCTPQQIASVYRRAWELGTKGVTVFRYGSKGEQVLQLGADETALEREHFTRCDPHACKL